MYTALSNSFWTQSCQSAFTYANRAYGRAQLATLGYRLITYHKLRHFEHLLHKSPAAKAPYVRNTHLDQALFDLHPGPLLRAAVEPVQYHIGWRAFCALIWA